MAKKEIYKIIIGTIFLIAGIYMAIFLKEAHFYSVFSIGAFLILFGIYNSTSKKALFNKWKIRDFFVFSFSLIVLSIIIDKIGIYLGYWTYPHFTNIFDEIIKYVFEWGVAFLYLMLSLMIGMNFFEKRGLGKQSCFVLSLIIFVTIIGLITEYINSFASSWKVLSMPVTDYGIGRYFLIFQTIGYWLTAVIPFMTYKIIDKK